MTTAGKARRIAVVVLGMHRSGTSALTRVLSLLGCDLPQNILPASPGNQLGHWESRSVMEVNERLLASAGSHVHDWQVLSPDWYLTPKADAFRLEAIAALAGDYGDSPLFVLKEPRICRLFPLWKSALESLGIDPVVMFPVRNPLEVAESLRRRDGFEVSWGYLMWLRNVLDAERESRGIPRHFSTYEQLLSNWANLADEASDALGVKWPISVKKAASQIDSFLSSDQRHHWADAETVLDNPLLSSWIKDVYRVMLNWTSNGERASDWCQLDRVHAEMVAAEPNFGRAVNAGWSAMRWGRELDQKYAKILAEEQKTKHALAKVDKLFSEATAEVLELRTALDLARTESVESRLQLEDRLAATISEVVELKELAQRLENEKAAAFAEMERMGVLATEFNQRIIEAVAGWRGNSLIYGSVDRAKEAILNRMGLFDREFYRSQYPDVEAAKVDPLRHFVRHGAREGRYWSREIAALGDRKIALGMTPSLTKLSR